MTVIHWHDILQDLLDEHLYDLCRKEVQYTSREFEKKVRYDYYCELDPDKKAEDDLYRPMAHMRRYNIIEFKSFHETFSSRSFYEYVGRLFQVLGGAPRKARQPTDKLDRWDQATLTIILARYPRAFFHECERHDHKVIKIDPWLYKIHMVQGLHIYIMILPQLRQQSLGYPTALLQALEHDPSYQPSSWDQLLSSEGNFADSIKRIIMKINEEGFMTYLEQIREEDRKAIENANTKIEQTEEALQQARSIAEQAHLELKRKDSIIEHLKAQVERLTGNNPSDLSFS